MGGGRRRADHARRRALDDRATTWARRCRARATCSRSPSRATCRAFFGRVHPRFRTPVNAILVTVGRVAGAGRVRHVLGRWRGAARSAGCSSTSRPARRRCGCASAEFAGRGQAGDVRRAVRAGDPGAAIVLALSMIAGARREQLIAGVIALIVGGLYVIAVDGAVTGDGHGFDRAERTETTGTRDCSRPYGDRRARSRIAPCGTGVLDGTSHRVQHLVCAPSASSSARASCLHCSPC